MRKLLRVLTVVAAGTLVLASAAPAQADGLPRGEYSCTWSKGQTSILGLAFKVVDGRRYTDLDGTTSGTYEVRGDKVYFHGGHLDGQVGEGMHDGNSFNFSGNDINCGPW